MPKRLAVLCSGGGSNLQAILDHLAALGDARAADVVLVASDREMAGALLRATRESIPAVAMDRAVRTTGMADLLAQHRIDLIALAGYLRFIPNDVTEAFRGRIVNIHPSLLPAFGGPGMYGHHVHEAVLAAGVRVSGATAHFVDAAYDRGPVIAQWPVPVFADDTADTLAARVLAVEHAMYPAVVQAVAQGDIALGGNGRVHGPPLTCPPSHFALSGDAHGASLALTITRGAH